VKRFEGKRTKNPRPEVGATLSEVLIVAGIILVLSALGFSVVLGSKGRAKEAAEISDLKQLALAGAMYHEENGEWPLSVIPLVNLKLAPASITSSALDGTPRGIANDLAFSIQEQCPACGVAPTTYRRTYVGPGDFGHIGDLFRKDIEPTSGAGWLVSLTKSRPGRENQPNDKFNNPTGDYLRVLLSGSVISRTHHRVVKAGGTVYAVQFMFADGDQAWRQRIAGGPPR